MGRIIKVGRSIRVAGVGDALKAWHVGIRVRTLYYEIALVLVTPPNRPSPVKFVDPHLPEGRNNAKFWSKHATRIL